MAVQTTIKAKLNNALNPSHLSIDNESHMHGGPATESHFKITVVSSKFDGLTLVKRHQEIYRLLADELAGDVHALALHTYSPSEWQEERHSVPDSPDCRGGSKLDK